MKGFRILVVEDEVLLQRVMEDSARLIGLPCEVVRTGQEALERLHQRAYDLLIQDMRLPDLSGTAIIQTARQIDPTLPIILITAYAVEAEVQQAVQQGVDAVLFKPFDIDTLLTSMRHLLIKRQVAQLTHAVVHGAAVESLPRMLPLLPEVPSAGAVLTLLFEGRRLMGRVCGGNELLFSVETPPDPEPIPAQVQVELVGRDALYRFRTRVVRHHPLEESARWVLKRPLTIRRLQRRREPRLPAHGHAVVSATGRMLRATEGELIDLSAHGVALKLPLELNKGTPVQLFIEWRVDGSTHTFQTEGIVRHTLALTEAGAPVYLIGIEVRRVPSATRALIRERLQHQLSAD